MSKITFRADDDLVERLEALETSKSEAMREALRAYLDGGSTSEDVDDGVDGAIAERVDELIAERLDAALSERLGRPAYPDPIHTADGNRDINVNVTLDGVTAESSETEPPTEPGTNREERTEDPARKTQGPPVETDPQAESKTCGGCGENIPEGHVYCPNCGEKTSHRAFCECGDEIRTDWAFCPGCGRRTPAADVLDHR